MSSKTKMRRKKQSISLGSVISAAAVAYGTYKVADWAWNRYVTKRKKNDYQVNAAIATSFMNFLCSQTSVGAHAEDGVASHIDHIPGPNRRLRMRRQRMTRCRQEAAQALRGFSPALRSIVELHTNTAQATRLLKQLRANRTTEKHATSRRSEEQALWKEIQRKTMTRMLTTAYAHTILFLVLTTQVNLLGGRLFEESLQNTSLSSNVSMSNDSVASDRMVSYQESHRFVLQHTYDYFLNKGVHSLLSTVEQAVDSVLGGWNVFDKACLHISREQFDCALVKIRGLIEGGLRTDVSRTSGRSSRRESILRFLMPSSILEHSIQDDLARSILDETWDLVESPVFSDAQQECLNATFASMRDRFWGKIFDDNGLSGTKPWAHVLTQLRTTSNSFFVENTQRKDYDSAHSHQSKTLDSPASIYCTMLETLPAVLELNDVSFN
jgi:peroxin-3